MRLLASIAIVTAAVVATPVLALSQNAAEPKPSIAAPVDGGTTATADNRKYCTMHIPTGTRIPLYDCRTRDRWIAEKNWDPARK